MADPSLEPAQSASRLRLLLGGIGLLALMALGLAWKWWGDSAGTEGNSPPPPAEAVDPRLTFATPYRNVHPKVKYVGDRACADCHFELFESYQGHPMGQAMAPVADGTPIERYDKAALNPFRALGLHYAIERRGKQLVQREWAEDAEGRVLAEIEADIPFVMGSGARARSYVVNHDGYLFQAPATWYPQAGKWDLSPGYETRNLHFTRPVAPGCLFCHCNYADHVPGTVNRYREPIFHGFAIGCERCHGPGQLHVQRRTSGERVVGLDDTIVNPARLEHSLREAVCQQCHIQGEQRVVCRGRSEFDYRPGLPLHLFIMDFVDAQNRQGDHKFVSSVEQLKMSKCYQQSSGPNKLGCISCHDPHRHPAPQQKIAHYRERCLKCHTDESCHLPVAERRVKSKEDSCIACHMPPLNSEVNHTAITDHRIPRRAAKRTEPPPRRTPGPDALVPFHSDLIDPGDPEASRNLGLALMWMLDINPPEEFARQYAAKALPLLERAFRRDARDLPVAEARATALGRLGRPEESLKAYETILTDNPKSETTLHAAGFRALAVNRPQIARGYLERAAAVNPWNWHYHHGLARASFRLKEYERAVHECRKSLSLELENPTTRSLLVQCYVAMGEQERARTEFRTLEHLTATNRRDDLRRWFAEVQRRFAP